MKKLKKVLCVTVPLVIALVCVIIMQKPKETVADTREKVDLRKVTPAECLEILLENGLEVHPAYADMPQETHEEMVYSVAMSVLDAPERISWYNYSGSQEYAIRIRDAVLMYEGIEDVWKDDYPAEIFEENWGK